MNIKYCIALLLLLFTLKPQAQNYKYRAEKERIVNLVHTKLDLSFDIPNSTLNGKAWVTLTPHFHDATKIELDAKGMRIHTIQMNGVDMPYNYFEEKSLTIELDRAYSKEEEFTVYIEYTANPNEYAKVNKDQKGLYFINPTGEDKNKLTHFWTEGEMENSSIWFPTIDSPNQRSSQEIYLTVPNEYVTLSNGTLISEQQNSDGTRTDYWKQDEKHPPYLFFIAGGAFSIVKDTWNDIPVHYYVEEEYEDVARLIFGMTPRMLEFFEEKLGVPYPWDKYHQIVVRDYVSGAMENSTAVIHSDNAYQEAGSLIDENIQEKVIAHEVMHHWFGNIATAESWSNLAMNEAFASYGEYLWFEHEYGKDYADAFLLDEREKYLKSKSETKDLIRFNYDDRDDMFDRVSYEKGGIILHMLRNYLSDEVFFAGLTKYLKDNYFSAVEAHHLRLAMEEVSGKDLNWFFNQWFYNSGHPKLQVLATIGEFDDLVTIRTFQSDRVFQFPLTVDIYEKDGRKSSHEVWVDGKERVFRFPTSSRPRLINVGNENVSLIEITQNKSLEQLVYQYDYKNTYESREEALKTIIKNQDNKAAFRAITKALNDPEPKLQVLALNELDLSNKYSKVDAVKIVERLARDDSNTLVQAAANITLAKLLDPVYVPHFEKCLSSKSFKVIESAVIALYQMDKAGTLNRIEQLPESVKDQLSGIITDYYIDTQDDKHLEYVSKHLMRGLFFVNDKNVNNKYKYAFSWVSKSDNEQAITNLVNSFVEVASKYKDYGADTAAMNYLRQMVQLQKDTDNTNKEELILIVRTGIAQLAQ